VAEDNVTAHHDPCGRPRLFGLRRFPRSDEIALRQDAHDLVPVGDRQERSFLQREAERCLVDLLIRVDGLTDRSGELAHARRPIILVHVLSTFAGV
jgi:hypothetical protein